MMIRHYGALRRGVTLLLTAALSMTMVVTGVGVTQPVLAADPPPKRKIVDAEPLLSAAWVDTTNNELFVGDDNDHSIIVYSRTASGAAAPLRKIQGLNTDLDFPSSVVLDLPNSEVWAVNNDTSDRAVVFGRTANGNVAPLRTIDLKAGIVERRGYGLDVDAPNNELIVSVQRGVAAPVYGAVHVFNRATGALLRSIKGANTLLADSHGVAVDTVNNEILVVNEGHKFGLPPDLPSLRVFARTANGDVAPLRSIQGASTGLSKPTHLSVDKTNNEIAVSNNDTNSITVHARTANGNVAPLRTISGALTGLSRPTGVYIDVVNNELFVANRGNRTVQVFARTANGNVAPLRTLTVGSATAVVGLGNPGALAVDTGNNEIHATNCVSHPRLAVYARLADGQVAPLRVIEGRSTRMSRSLHGVALDTVNNEVFLPSTMEDAVLVFNRVDSGNVAPKRLIQGPLTKINKPQGVAIDTTNNEIALVNESTPSVTIYALLANGNVAPLREITNGDAAAMAKPVGVWIDAVNNEIMIGEGGTEEVAAAVLVFPRLANGPTNPIRTITGPNTLLNKTRQVVVDTVNNEIVVASQGDRAVNPPVFGTVTVFDRLANGDVAPKRFLQHVTVSNVKHPRSVYVDTVNDEIGVGDSKENEIRIFPRVF